LAEHDELEMAARIAEAEPEPEGPIPLSLQYVGREELVRATVRATRNHIAAAIRDLAARTTHSPSKEDRYYVGSCSVCGRSAELRCGVCFVCARDEDK